MASMATPRLVSLYIIFNEDEYWYTQVLKQLREISKTEVMLAFAATCVEALARSLSISYYEAFRKLKEADLFNTQIFPYYDVLHTESREVVVQRLIEAIPHFSSQND